MNNCWSNIKYITVHMNWLLIYYVPYWREKHRIVSCIIPRLEESLCTQYAKLYVSKIKVTCRIQNAALSCIKQLQWLTRAYCDNITYFNYRSIYWLLMYEIHLVVDERNPFFAFAPCSAASALTEADIIAAIDRVYWVPEKGETLG